MTQESISQPPSKIAAWFYAARPRTLTAGVMPVIAATALGYQQYQEWSLLVLICGILSAMCIQIGINYTNDALDFLKGADDEKRIGFDRAVQKKWISAKSMLWGGYAAFIAGIIFSLPVAISSPWILAITLMCVIMGYFYTGGPFPIAYNGLGEIFVLLFFGWAITGTVYYAQTGSYNLSIFILGLQIGLLAAAIIAMNNYRDLEQDKKADKRTLAVRWGLQYARYEISSFLIIPFLLNIYWWDQGYYLLALVPLLVFPIAIQIARDIWTYSPSAKCNQLFIKCALVHLAFTLLFSITAMLS